MLSIQVISVDQQWYISLSIGNSESSDCLCFISWSNWNGKYEIYQTHMVEARIVCDLMFPLNE